MPTFVEARNHILKTLREIGIADGETRRECDLILQHATELSTAQQILHSTENLPDAKADLIEEILLKRRERIPLQYCIGATWFMDSKFYVEPGVFIPRADTEILVQTCSSMIAASDNEKFRERVISQTHESQKFRVVEVGIGSGAISVCLLKMHRAIEIIALELSPRPCAVSRKNAKLNGVSERLCIEQGDWRELLPDRIDMLVSNPPYIPRSDAITLEPEVAWHEPKEALFGTDDDGLGFYRDFANLVPSHLRDGIGAIAVEVGDKQSDSVSQIFASAGWTDIDVKLDMNGIPRVVTARK